MNNDADLGVYKSNCFMVFCRDSKFAHFNVHLGRLQYKPMMMMMIFNVHLCRLQYKPRIFNQSSTQCPKVASVYLNNYFKVALKKTLR